MSEPQRITTRLKNLFTRLPLFVLAGGMNPIGAKMVEILDKEAIRLIPGPVVPLIPANLSPYSSLQEQQDTGAVAAWFPALTTMAGLQANWDFLSDFKQRGTQALDALRAQAAKRDRKSTRLNSSH